MPTTMRTQTLFTAGRETWNRVLAGTFPSRFIALKIAYEFYASFA